MDRSKTKMKEDGKSARECGNEALTLLYEKMHSALSELSCQKFRSQGSFDEIFPIKERDDDRPFLFRQIIDDDDVNQLIEALRNTSAVTDNWNGENWLSLSLEDEDRIIVVKREGDVLPAGFAAINIFFHTQMEGLLDHIPTIHLSVNLEAVYIRPDERGKGYSQALSWAIAEHVTDILHSLAELPQARRESFEHLTTEVFVNGAAHSEGGARFLSRTFERIERNLELFTTRSHWFKGIELTDNIDFRHYPDRGLDHERNYPHEPIF